MNSIINNKEVVMKKKIIIAVVFAAALIGFLAKPGTSEAGVHLNIGFYVPFPGVVVAPPPPPAFVFPAPPRVVAVPRTNVYYVPGIEGKVFFYGGDWYRPHGKRWYMARHYNGPWDYIGPKRVPYALRTLPEKHYYKSRRYDDRRHDYGRYDGDNRGHWNRERRHRW
jgi:hypothetical protein